MIVLDASAAVDWLLQTSSGRRIENRVYARGEALHAPHLVDREVTQVLRRLTQQGIATRTRADEAVRDLLDLRVTRHPHLIFAAPHLAATTQFLRLRGCLYRTRCETGRPPSHP